jgi:hypothetical protein
VALRDPTDLRLIDELAFRSGRRIEVLVAGEHEVSRAIARLYSPAGEPLSLELADEVLPLEPEEDHGELELLALCEQTWSALAR